MNTLFIAWQDPETRRWIPVGRLTYENDRYRFVYTQGATVSPKFQPFGSMRELFSNYESEELFPLFANRLLARNRPEYKTYLGWLNIQGESRDPFDELSRTGGVRATDSLSVFQRPEPKGDGTYNLSFFSHGIRHLPQEAQRWVEHLETGGPLYLMQDCQNEQDPLAIAMRTEPVMVVGYVPRYYAEDFRFLLSSKASDSVRVWVEKVNLDAPIQLRLLCTIKAMWPENFQPCSGDLYTPLV